MAASIITAHGLPDLVADSLQDYRELAIGLARDPSKLQTIKTRVAENRTQAPLFDGQGFVQGLEQAYREMWTIHQAGEKPRPIDLSVDPD